MTTSSMAAIRESLREEAQEAEYRRGQRSERWRCIKIILEALDTGEYERSLAQSIVQRIMQ